MSQGHHEHLNGVMYVKMLCKMQRGIEMLIIVIR